MHDPTSTARRPFESEFNAVTDDLRYFKIVGLANTSCDSPPPGPGKSRPEVFDEPELWKQNEKGREGSQRSGSLTEVLTKPLLRPKIDVQVWSAIAVSSPLTPPGHFASRTLRSHLQRRDNTDKPPLAFTARRRHYERSSGSSSNYPALPLCSPTAGGILPIATKRHCRYAYQSYRSARPPRPRRARRSSTRSTAKSSAPRDEGPHMLVIGKRDPRANAVSVRGAPGKGNLAPDRVDEGWPNCGSDKKRRA